MIHDSQKLYLLKILIWFSSFVIVLFHYALWFSLDFHEKNIFIDYLVKRKEYGANFVYLYWAITGYIFISFYYLKKKIILKNYFVNIFAKYYPLHIFTLIIVFIIQYLNLNLYGETQFGYANDLYHFVLHLFFASDWGLHINQSFNAPIWFMSILIPIFIFFFLTFKFLVKFKIFFSIFIMIFFYYFFPLVFGYQKSIFNILACFFYFYMGISIFFICEFKKKNKKKFQILSIFGILISIFALNYNKSFLSEYVNLIPSTVLLFSSLIILCQNYYIKFNKIPKKINTFIDTSYSIYLWHFPLQLFFIIMFNFLKIDLSVFKNFTYFLIFLTVLFSISVISSKKFEKPCKKLIENYF
tara:strand:+ start:332 stop:1399 length:1068 start_codon:yes stop_codon:yes gene_type:complete